MKKQAIQDSNPEYVSNCFGCGKNNEHGLQIKSYWEADEVVCTWMPKDYHLGGNGFLNGGIMATLIDCHCMNTAGAFLSRVESTEEMRTGSFATGTLTVKFLRPTPMDQPLILRARVTDMKEKKIIITCSVFSGEDECAHGEVIAIRIPEGYWKE